MGESMRIDRQNEVTSRNHKRSAQPVKEAASGKDFITSPAEPRSTSKPFTSLPPGGPKPPSMLVQSFPKPLSMLKAEAEARKQAEADAMQVEKGQDNAAEKKGDPPISMAGDRFFNHPSAETEEINQLPVNTTFLNKLFEDSNGFNKLISKNENKSDNSNKGETNKSPNDGSTPNPLAPAKIYFKNVPKDVLAGIKIIPENAKSNKDLKNAENGRWYETDGLWINGQEYWYKIPNINTVIITYDNKKQEIRFNVETNIWGSILWSWKMTTPDFVPDSGKTEHITNYPF